MSPWPCAHSSKACGHGRVNGTAKGRCCPKAGSLVPRRDPARLGGQRRAAQGHGQAGSLPAVALLHHDLNAFVPGEARGSAPWPPGSKRAAGGRHANRGSRALRVKGAGVNGARSGGRARRAWCKHHRITCARRASGARSFGGSCLSLSLAGAGQTRPPVWQVWPHRHWRKTAAPQQPASHRQGAS
jgi:hypothetical protein